MEDDDSRPTSVDTITYAGLQENVSENLSDVESEAEEVEKSSEPGSSNHNSAKIIVNASTQTTQYGPTACGFSSPHILHK